MFRFKLVIYLGLKSISGEGKENEADHGPLFEIRFWLHLERMWKP
jgi:hypothetical protein